MDFEINRLEKMTGIFRELSPENQSRLLECSQISQIAENAVKKAFSGQYPCDAANSEGRERTMCREEVFVGRVRRNMPPVLEEL
jgi:hypothetical protein